MSMLGKFWAGKSIDAYYSFILIRNPITNKPEVKYLCKLWRLVSSCASVSSNIKRHLVTHHAVSERNRIAFSIWKESKSSSTQSRNPFTSTKIFGRGDMSQKQHLDKCTEWHFVLCLARNFINHILAQNVQYSPTHLITLHEAAPIKVDHSTL